MVFNGTICNVSSFRRFEASTVPKTMSGEPSEHIVSIFSKILKIIMACDTSGGHNCRRYRLMPPIGVKFFKFVITHLWRNGFRFLMAQKNRIETLFGAAQKHKNKILKFRKYELKSTSYQF